MCGIVGFFNPKGFTQEQGQTNIQNMARTIAHRGPDDEGCFVDALSGVALGYRRLAIVDTSYEGGHQPMTSHDGRYTLVYNGETYNHHELASLLTSKGTVFKGHSDTEIIVESFATFGIDETLSQLRGMFALAVWDHHAHSLTLIRDRLGKKPLYYGYVKDFLVFGSELKTIHAFHPTADFPINPVSFTDYMRYGAVQGELSIYKNIFKIKPGTLQIWQGDKKPEIRIFYDLPQKLNTIQPFQGSFHEAQAYITRKLNDAVSMRLPQDVPYGAFLSGGIDSSLIVALMANLSSQPVQTFSVGFEEAQYNESTFAQCVAQHFGTQHTNHIVTTEDILNTVHTLPVTYDEPFADASQIPTYIVSRLARQHVPVVLTGDGGDEVFGGYDRYALALKIHGYMKRMPFPKVIGKALYEICRLLPKSNRLARLAYTLKGSRLQDVYEMTLRTDPYDSYISQDVLPYAENIWTEEQSDLRTLQLKDLLFYLCSDILVKVDRATMANSLEGRSPLLDHHLMEAAWSLPDVYLQKNGQSKIILKEILKNFLPQDLIHRPKMGFGVPLGKWLRGPLKKWAEERLYNLDTRLNQKVVMTQWKQHLLGETDASSNLWRVLMWQAWVEQWER